MKSAGPLTTADTLTTPGEVDRIKWLRSWLTTHGFVDVPFEGVDPRVLAISMAAEFESWCEQRGIDESEQERVRRTVARSLEAQAMIHWDAFLVARDAAAWHALRRRRSAADVA